MSSEKTIPTKPLKFSSIDEWHYETDVAVVGFGGAGACAAIEAADAGKRVMLMDLAAGSGGSTALSSAEIYMGGNGGTRVQAALGYADTNQAMIDYLTNCAGPQADVAKIKAYVEGSVDHFNWLVAQGVPFKDSEYTERAIMAMTDDCLLYTGSEKAWPFNKTAKPCPRGHNLEVEGDNGGPLFMKIMTENVERRDIDVQLNCRALSLIQDEDGEIKGLRVRIDMQERNVRALNGVVLCAGGFVMNEAMVKKYAPSLQRCTVPIGNVGDMGSGLLLGMGVGGAAINMHEGFVSLPYYPPSTLTYGIFINSAGQRFINEDCYHGRVGAFALQQSGDRIYLVLSVDDYGAYETESYLGAPVAGTGETIEELEHELDLPAGQLVQTLATYNRHAANAEDPIFHKTAEWLKELKAPYVALDCTPGRGAFLPYFTLGGLDTMPSGEVLTPEGNVIAGLYAAGRTACGVPRRGAGYNSGISVGDATFTGRMAGQAAAART